MLCHLVRPAALRAAVLNGLGNVRQGRMPAGADGQMPWQRSPATRLQGACGLSNRLAPALIRMRGASCAAPPRTPDAMEASTVTDCEKGQQDGQSQGNQPSLWVGSRPRLP